MHSNVVCRDQQSTLLGRAGRGTQGTHRQPVLQSWEENKPSSQNSIPWYFRLSMWSCRHPYCQSPVNKQTEILGNPTRTFLISLCRPAKPRSVPNIGLYYWQQTGLSLHGRGRRKVSVPFQWRHWRRIRRKLRETSIPQLMSFSCLGIFLRFRRGCSNAGTFVCLLEGKPSANNNKLRSVCRQIKRIVGLISKNISLNRDCDRPRQPHCNQHLTSHYQSINQYILSPLNLTLIDAD